MTLPDRVVLGAERPDAVFEAGPLLAEFNDAGVLSPLDVLAAQAVANLFVETDDSAVLAVALAVRGSRQGHVCIRLGEQPEVIVVEGADAGEVEVLPWPEPATWAQAIARSRLVGDGGSDLPLVLEGDRLYLERFHRYEELVAGFIRERAARPAREVPTEVAESLAGILTPADENGRPERQYEAALSALAGSLTVIAGGPGTGKTYTVAALLRAMATAGLPLSRIALCAPTGKAAARLGDQIAEAARNEGDQQIKADIEAIEPTTIHRLLGFHPGRGRFAHDEYNPLPHDLVVVDETSMLSLPLAAKVIAALRPRATLVLVGDPDQLESIEAGTLLADIVGAGSASRVVTLERRHRFDEHGDIAALADAVRDDDADRAMELLGTGGESGLMWVRGRDDEAFDRLEEEVRDHRARVIEIASERGGGSAALDELMKMAVLAAHRRGPNSVASWRDDIESWLAGRFPSRAGEDLWYPGQPIMITRNNYALELYNGDIGVVAETDDGLRVVFKRRDVRSYPRSHLTDFETVHALTIHKSQGSEFDRVIVSLPDESSRLLTRQLLYTAVTRARTGVTVIGSEAVIRQAIERSVPRASGLGEKLA